MYRRYVKRIIDVILSLAGVYSYRTINFDPAGKTGRIERSKVVA